MKKYILYILTLIFLSGCSGKIDFLDERPDKSRVVPESLEDLQGLLDNTQTMNGTLSLGLLGCDDGYTNEEGYDRLRFLRLRNGYLWKKDVFEGESSVGWNRSYEQIFVSNVVLSHLDDLVGGEKRKEEIRGSALFYRAHAYFQLLQIFARQYNAETSLKDPGVPIKRTTKVDEAPGRSSVGECYEYIEADLEEAVSLLAEYDPVKSRPVKYAAYALLARIHLQKGEYTSALEWGRKVLAGPYDLLNYREFDGEARYPFPRYNREVIFHTELLNLGYSTSSRTMPDTVLQGSYDTSDLRTELFFLERSGRWNHRGQYTGTYIKFSGLALDEVYLTIAECQIRLGNVTEGMNVLNELLMTRWKEGEYIPYEANTEEEALRMVLEERRKSLLFRGINWMDLRRLNTDPRFARTLRRTIDGQTYELPPNDPRYVYPIPDDEIRYNPVEQNER